MEKTNGMFGEHGNKLKRDILDVIMYHTEDQDENYRPTIQLLCGWFNEHGFPIYLYYQFEIHRKMVHANLEVWAEAEGSSDLISTLSVFSFPKRAVYRQHPAEQRKI